MKLGEKQVLTVVKIVDFGVYLGNDEERVLLPKKHHLSPNQRNKDYRKQLVLIINKVPVCIRGQQ